MEKKKQTKKSRQIKTVQEDIVRLGHDFKPLMATASEEVARKVLRYIQKASELTSKWTKEILADLEGRLDESE